MYEYGWNYGQDIHEYSVMSFSKLKFYPLDPWEQTLMKFE